MALADNKTKIQALLDGINALPDAGGGGLPTGVSALASGTFTPASNMVYAIITHNLGVVPNFSACVIEEDVYTEDIFNNPLTYILVGCASFKKNITSRNYEATILNSGYDSDGLYRTHGWCTEFESGITDTDFLLINDAYPFKRGYTYRWICGVMDGIK